jgi:uncharacterized membrane protein YciS (DUF1049 family)
MHPLLTGRLRPLAYFFIWFGIWGLITAVFGGLQQRPFGATVAFTAPLIIVYAFVCRSAWWVCRANPLDRTPPLRLLGRMGGAAILASLSWIVLGAVWDSILTTRFHLAPGREGLPADLAILWVAGIVLYLQSLAAHYFLLAQENARAAERRLLETQVTAREAELRALRAQLHPHFLFTASTRSARWSAPTPRPRGACAGCWATSCAPASPWADAREWRSKRSWPWPSATSPSSRCASAHGSQSSARWSPRRCPAWCRRS